MSKRDKVLDALAHLKRVRMLAIRLVNDTGIGHQRWIDTYNELVEELETFEGGAKMSDGKHNKEALELRARDD